jgi:hypothetical protein
LQHFYDATAAAATDADVDAEVADADASDDAIKFKCFLKVCAKLETIKRTV